MPPRIDIFKIHSVGESSSGKASRSLAQHIPGPGGIEGVKGAASGVVGELARARLALDERGQKLGDLEERTAAMLSSADSFSKHAHEVCPACIQPTVEILGQGNGNDCFCRIVNICRHMNFYISLHKCKFLILATRGNHYKNTSQ